MSGLPVLEQTPEAPRTGGRSPAERCCSGSRVGRAHGAEESEASGEYSDGPTPRAHLALPLTYDDFGDGGGYGRFGKQDAAPCRLLGGGASVGTKWARGCQGAGRRTQDVH